MRRAPAWVGEPNEAIERRLRYLETKPPLDLDAVDRAIAGIRNPERLAERLAAPLQYSQRVEAEVAGLGIEVLLPHAAAHGDFVGRFLEIWVPDELGHAEALARVIHRLELDIQHPGNPSVPVHNRIAGMLGRISASAYELVSYTYHSIGAINERLALAAYARMAEIVTELGEHELAEVLFAKLRSDESAHLGYYRTHARQLAGRVAPWQRKATRTLIVRTYAPVGAGKAADKPAFGAVLAALEADPHDFSIGRQIDELARDLLAEPGSTLPPFVVDAMRRCLPARPAQSASSA